MTIRRPHGCHGVDGVSNGFACERKMITCHHILADLQLATILLPAPLQLEVALVGTGVRACQHHQGIVLL